MINQKMMPKVYREVFEIIKHLSEEDFNKIPKEVIETLHVNMDKEYEVNINFEDFQNQKPGGRHRPESLGPGHPHHSTHSRRRHHRH